MAQLVTIQQPIIKTMDVIEINPKKPSTRKVKVSEIQLCGGTMHKWLNEQSPRGMPFQKFMEDNPEDPRIPLMNDMVAMDKQFHDKLQPILKIKERSDARVKELLHQHCDTIHYIYSDLPNERKLRYDFKTKESCDKYFEDIAEADKVSQKELDEFRESEVDITPIYAQSLPHFNMFPDKPELRDPLKGFILPLD